MKASSAVRNIPIYMAASVVERDTSSRSVSARIFDAE